MLSKFTGQLSFRRGEALTAQVTLQLRLELLDLSPQVGYYTFVSADVQTHHFLIRLYLHFYVFGSVGIFQSIYRLFVLEPCRTDSGNHYCLAVATERVLQHAGKLAVSEGHKGPLFVFITQSIDAVGQSQQRSVDFSSLHQPQSSIFSDCASFRTSQIN
jgi:hypothetical protein